MNNKINQAMIDRTLLSITYVDKKKQVSVRSVEPYEIKDGKLYAHCRSRNGIRAFDLSNISSMSNTEIPFTPRFPIKLEGVVVHDGEVANNKGSRKK